MKYSLIPIFCLAFGILQGQNLISPVGSTVYAIAYDSSDAPRTRLMQITFEDRGGVVQGTVTTVQMFNHRAFGIQRMTDLAIGPDGTFYAIAQSGNTYSLVRLDLTFGGLMSVRQLPPLGPFNALVCDANGVLYAAGSHVVSFDTRRNQVVTLGPLPAGVTMGGDLAFYGGRLLYTGTEASTVYTQWKIYEIDLKNTRNNLIVNATIEGVFGVLNLNLAEAFSIFTDDCVNYRLIFTRYSQNPTLPEGLFIQGSSINNRPSPWNLVGYPLPSTRGPMMGFAHPKESAASTCKALIDLDLDADNSTAQGRDFQGGRCQNRPAGVVDVDMKLETGIRIDSIRVRLLAPPPGADLSATASSFVTISGQSSTWLTLIRSSSTTSAHFIAALKSVLLDGPINPNGQRVQILAYSGISRSDTAYATIWPRTVPLRRTIEATVCPGRSFRFNNTEIPAGTTREFSFTTSGGCDSIVKVVVTAKTEAFPGTMDSRLLEICSNPNTLFRTNFPVDTALKAGDVLRFILHTRPDYPLGQIVAWSTQPEFVFQPGLMTLDSIYYISAIVGKPDGADKIDLSDPCIAVAKGTPVRASVPPTFTYDRTACVSDPTAVIPVQFTGKPPFTISFSNNGVSQAPVTNIPANDFNITFPIITDRTDIGLNFFGDSRCNIRLAATDMIVAIRGVVPTIANLTKTCSPDGLTFTVSFDVTGTPPFTTTGTQGTFVGNRFTSIPLVSGSNFSGSLREMSGCGSATFVGTHTCNSCTPKSNAVNASVCSGGSYRFGTRNLTVTGTYRDTLRTAAGCDSVVVLALSITPAVSRNLTASICPGGSYRLGTRNLTVAGTYRDTLRTAAGCDSVVVLALSITPAVSRNLTASICPGGSYRFGSRSLTNAGIYRDTLRTAAGCDSVLVLNLSVTSVISRNLTASICPGGTYRFGSRSLNAAGTYRDTLRAAGGCDSVLVLNLSVTSVISRNLTASICRGGSYRFGSRSLNAAGTYRDTLRTAAGCDSVRVLTLSVTSTISRNLTASICPGGTYRFGSRSLNAAGTYRDTLRTAAGCDSVLVLNLSVTSVISRNLTASICPGGTYRFGSRSLTNAGTYRDTLRTAAGCDSVLVLNLSVTSTISRNLTASICRGGSYRFGTRNLNAAGIYRDTLRTAVGCDSVLVLDLAIAPPIVRNIAVSICSGGSYRFGSRNLTAARTYRDTLRTAGGCDSVLVLTLDLLVSPIANRSLTVRLCPGKSYRFGSRILTAAGIYRDTLRVKSDCDSVLVLTLNLSVLPPISRTLTANICPGSAYRFGSRSLTAAGTYRDTFRTKGGCDSLVVLNLSVLPTVNRNLTASICPGGTYRFGSRSLNAAGTYRDTLRTAAGCDSVLVLDLSVSPALTIQVPAPPVLPRGGKYTIALDFTASPAKIRWSPPRGLSCADCPSPVARPDRTTTYTVVATDGNGCTAVDSLTIVVQSALEGIYVPNAFAPNSREQSIFTVFAQPGFVESVVVLRIYERWGTLLFESRNFTPGDLSVGWDGRYRNQPVAPGVYVWYAEIRLANGDQRLLSGDVLVAE